MAGPAVPPHRRVSNPHRVHLGRHSLVTGAAELLRRLPQHAVSASSMWGVTQIARQQRDRGMGREEIRDFPGIVVTDKAEILRTSPEEIGPVGLVRVVAEDTVSLCSRRVSVRPGRDLLHVVVTRHTQFILGQGEGQRIIRERIVAGLAIRLGIGCMNEGAGFLLR